MSKTYNAPSLLSAAHTLCSLLALEALMSGNDRKQPLEVKFCLPPSLELAPACTDLLWLSARALQELVATENDGIGLGKKYTVQILRYCVQFWHPLRMKDSEKVVQGQWKATEMVRAWSTGLVRGGWW